MNTESLEKMKSMRLLGMYKAFKSSLETNATVNVTADEMIAMLVDSEWDDRHNRKSKEGFVMRTSVTRLPLKTLIMLQKEASTKNHVHRLADGEFVKKREDLLIT